MFTNSEYEYIIYLYFMLGGNILSLLEAFVLGIIQGLTEFLPISSSGHLVLLEKIFRVEAEGTMSFNIAVHIATLLPVLWIFRKDVINIVKKPFSRITALIIAGTAPTVIIAVIFSDFIDNAFISGAYLGICFLATGLALWLAESVGRGNKNVDSSSFLDVAFVGIAQGIAILPGISRSGFTITGGLLRRFDREFALKFSFLLSIPAIIGAALKEGYEMHKAGLPVISATEVLPVVIGMLAAAVSGYIAVKFMIRVLTRGSLKIFSYYTFILGILVLADQLITRVIF